MQYDKLSFPDIRFDYVYCLGVLQRTPDVSAAFRALADKVKPGGHLAVHVYPNLFRKILSIKDWVRPIMRRMDGQKLFSLCERLVPRMLPVSRVPECVPRVGSPLRRLIAINNHEGVFRLSETQHREWAYLDTYDMLAPRYVNPQTARTVRSSFASVGFQDVEVFRHGHLIGRGTRPQ